LIIGIAVLVAAIGGYLYWESTQGREVLLVSTTTSLFDTGLLDSLEDDFESRYDMDIRFTAVGTGIAIQQAERGDVDCSLVHAPSLEREFLESGNGVNRRIIAYNYYTIVGPDRDPAGIKGMAPLEALRKIVDTGGTFVSRDDNSGTNTKELEFWENAGYSRDDLLNHRWYMTTGQGMGATLVMADELGGYTLADMGTYLKYYADGRIDLVVLVEGGKELMNVYSAIAVNPQKHPNVNFDGAMRFIDYLCTDETQTIIEEYGVSDYGRPLFYPARELIESGSGETYEWLREIGFIDGAECPPQYLYRAQ
jgi:tungstate transport system substrate-binding protein